MVPKLLRPLVKYWVPEAFVVSFKVTISKRPTLHHVNWSSNPNHIPSPPQLETDENILMDKARKALKKYGHKLVIANELKSRKYKVVFVTEGTEEVGVVMELYFLSKSLKSNHKMNYHSR